MPRKNYRSMPVYALLSLLLILFSTAASARIYKYRDKNGQVHVTDRLSEVPADQRPEVVKKPDSPAEPEKSGKEESDREASETVKSPDSANETPQNQTDAKGTEIPIVEELNKEKAALDEIHAQLMTRKSELQKERETLKTPEQVRDYKKKVAGLNEEIDAYAKRNEAFQKKADAYNAAVREKGEK